MPIIKTVNEDIFKDPEIKFIAHGVNCSGKFNAGFARQVRLNFPHVYNSYDGYMKDWIWGEGNSPESMIGRVQVVSGSITFYNIFTQRYYGRNKNERYVSYDAIDDSFKALNRVHKYDYPIGIPKIGSGLGGGNWNVIKEIINHRTPNIDIILYSLD